MPRHKQLEPGRIVIEPDERDERKAAAKKSGATQAQKLDYIIDLLERLAEKLLREAV